MVLDEPTSALDHIAEADIYRNFAGLTQDKTTLLVFHRLGICSVVDRIIVFDKGQIVEDGTHEELMEKHGIVLRSLSCLGKMVCIDFKMIKGGWEK